MIKIISPDSQHFGESVSSIIKVSSNGLVGSDLSTFIKRAGASGPSLLKGLDFKPGEQPIHMIAIGSTEAYGPNRNGDGFKEATCRKYHSSFVKHARWYRNHKNKDTEKSYGIVKASMFNDKMKRVELIVALNATKEAADRNKGLVADKEMHKVASGDDNWGVSMACRVAHDVCSGCGNKAKNRDEYCTEDMCKYGGCRSNLTKVAEDGHVLHVDNPNPTWFDISDVYRPADRIAWVVGHYKAASSNAVIGGAELAELAGIQSEDSAWASDLPKELTDMARWMSGIEKESSNFSPAYFTAIKNRTMPLAFVKAAGHNSWKACADNGIIVPLEDWLFSKGYEKIAEEVKPYLYNIFSRMLSDTTSFEKAAADSIHDIRMIKSSEKNGQYAYIAAPASSVSRVFVEQEIRNVIVRGTPSARVTSYFSKSAGDNSTLKGIAMKYAAHQLQWLKMASAGAGASYAHGKAIVVYNQLI